MTENWLPHPKFTSYEVSDQGSVRSIERTVHQKNGRVRVFPGCVLRQTPDQAGYLRVCCCAAGTETTVRVHVLVCETFHGARPSAAHQVCHGNGNRVDNQAVNLRWGTNSDNVRDAIRHGTHNHAGKTHCVNGHELIGQNIMPRRDALRKCRECNRVNQARYNRKRPMISRFQLAAEEEVTL